MHRDVAADRGLEKQLTKSGLPATAIAHAHAIRRRGYEGTSIGELLVDLGHLSASALAEAQAAMCGCERWDGELDPDLARAIDLHGQRVLAVRLSGGILAYATTDPADESVRAAVRMAAKVRSVEPLAATADAISAARRRLALANPNRERWEMPRIPRPPTLEDELRFRDQGADDDAAVRFANLLLRDHVFSVPGGNLRIELFDEPRALAGCCGHFEPASVPPFASLLSRAVWQFKRMAALEPGDGDQHGHFWLVAGSVHRSFEVVIATTTKGQCAVVYRHVPPFGALCQDPRWVKWRAHVEAAGRARSEPDTRGAVSALRAAVKAAEELGDEAALDLVGTLDDLAGALDDDEQEEIARPIAERALTLARRFGLGTRCEGQLLARLASTTIDDLCTRADRFAAAEERLHAPGVGRSPFVHAIMQRAVAELAIGQSVEAVQTCARAWHELVAWYGAPVAESAHSILHAAFSHLEGGDLEAATRAALEGRDIAKALHVPGADAYASWVLATVQLVRGQARDGLDLLRAACDDLSSAGLPDGEARGELALALDDAGDANEAYHQAARALAGLNPRDAFTAKIRSRLETLLRRHGGYR